MSMEVKLPMNEKPNYYDGSGMMNNKSSENDFTMDEPIEVTKEMRTNISGNPYTNEKIE